MDKIARSRVVLACAWLLAFAMYCPTLCIPPIVGMLRQQLHVSYAAIGTLFSLPYIMLVALAIPGGHLGDRIGPRKAVALGAVVMAAGSLMRGLSTTIVSLAVFTGLFGVGFSIIFPNLPKLVSIWFPREKVGLATGIYTTGVTAGGTLALAITLPVVFPLFHTIGGTFFAWGLPAALGAVLWLILARDPPFSPAGPEGPAKAAARSGGPSLWKNSHVWTTALLLFLNNVHFYTWVAWMPTLLVMKGAPADLAALISSSRGWFSLPVMFLMPWASYKVGLRKPFLWGSALLLVAASWAAIYMPVSWGWPLMAVVGIATGGTFPLILALTIELLPRESVGAASGIVLSMGYIAAFIGPWLAGRILDATGSLDPVLIVLIAAAVVWAVVGFAIPETGRKAPDRAR